MTLNERQILFDNVFLNANGKVLLEEIQKLCGADRDQFNPDPYINAFNSGKASIYYAIKKIVEKNINNNNEPKPILKGE